jgi:hypothetical protein
MSVMLGLDSPAVRRALVVPDIQAVFDFWELISALAVEMVEGATSVTMATISTVGDEEEVPADCAAMVTVT